MNHGEEVAAEAWQGPWSAGEHRLEAEATDRVGNTSRIGPIRFVVDAEGPEIEWELAGESVTGENGMVYYRPPVELRAIAHDVPAGVASLETAEDGESFSALVGARRLDGESLRLRATDRVGNVTTEIATWHIDREPPSLRIEARGVPVPPGGQAELMAGEALTLKTDDDGAGVAAATYRLERLKGRLGRSTAGQMPQILRFDDPGHWQLTLEAVDRLGNPTSVMVEVQVRRGN